MYLVYLILVLCTICVRSENEIKTYKPGKIHRTFHELITVNNITNSTCAFDIIDTIDAMNQQQLWAVKMLDASSKLQSGFALGNFVNLGSYDECLSIKGKTADREIKGKYCLFVLFLTANKEVNISNRAPTDMLEMAQENQGIPIIESICVPDSCSSRDLAEVFTESSISHISPVKPAFYEQFCQVKENTFELTPLHWFTLFLIVGDLLLIVICTAYDLFLQQRKQKPYHKLLISFSLHTNIKQFTTVRHDPDQLPCINGIRFISILWVVLGHTYVFTAQYPHKNTLYILKWIQEDTSAIIMGAFFAVDNFFLISGLLVMYVVLLAKAKGFKFSIIHYYLHRIFRLWPAMFMLILFYMTFAVYFSTGPFKSLIYAFQQRPCDENWWVSMIFLQNIIINKDVCVQQSWYLAIDTQLYVLAPLIFIPIQKWPKTILGIIVTLIMISCVSAFIIAWNLELSATFFGLWKSYRNFYASTLVRSNAWLIGSLLGYYLFMKRRKTIKIHKGVVALLWILSIGIMSWIIYVQAYFLQTEYNRLTACLYHSLSKPFWCLSLSWIIFACVHGYGGFVTKFLSNKVFVVLGRLTYTIYLVHILVICLLMIRKQSNTVFSNANTIHDYLGHTIYVILCSFVWTLCFESPIIAVGKALMPQEKADKLAKIKQENEFAHKQLIINDHFSTRL